MRNVCSWLLVGVAALLMAVEPAFAEDGATTSALSLFGAYLGLGIAALGGALGQGKIISSVVEAISRNPGAASQMGNPWILGLAFIESLVLLAFLIALIK